MSDVKDGFASGVPRAGEPAICRDAFGKEHTKRAVSGVVQGGSMPVVMLMEEEDWQASGKPVVRNARTYKEVWLYAPDAYGWPAEDVRAE